MKKALLFTAMSAMALQVGMVHAGTVDTEDGDTAQPTSVCYNDFREKINRKLENMVTDVCASEHISLDPSLEGPGGGENPLVYTSQYGQSAGCDLGFSMPGLPDLGFNGSFKWPDSCEILKKVTGGMVDKVNKQMQTVVNDAVDAASDATGGAIGGDGFHIDLNDLAKDTIDGK